jgi:energy-coupling factor transporter ATP-binding protein EcfA2
VQETLSEGKSNAPSIQQEISEWALKAPPWQRNLLARICRGDLIDAEYISMVAQQVIDNAVSLELPALTESDLPSGETGGDSVCVFSLGDLKNINVLIEQQTLSFGESGITVVYGDNGSGKSGYARLLKQLLGARHHAPLLPDAFSNSEGPQEATVRVAINGTVSERSWNEADDPVLRHAHFYDEACGDDYLESDTTLAYRPSVLAIFDRLIESIDMVRYDVEKLVAETRRIDVGLPVLPQGTAAQNFVSNLRSTTKQTEVDEFLNLDAPAESELARLVKEEARLKTTDPSTEKTRLSAGATQVSTLADDFGAISALLGPDPLAGLGKSQFDAQALRTASDAVSVEAFSAEPLAGVGEQTWRALWEAAEQYSATEAYPGREFPATEEGDRCVLCQQLLDEGSERLQRFHVFVHNDIAQRAQIAESNLAAAVEGIQDLEVSSTKVAAALNFLKHEDPTLAESLEGAIAQAQEVKDRTLRKLGGQSEDEPLALVAVDLAALRKQAEGLATRASTIDDRAFEAAFVATSRDRQELEGRVLLSRAKSAVEAEVRRLKTIAAMERRLASVSTQSATKEVGRLARKYVTDAVKATFVREAKFLQLDHVELGDRPDSKGAVRHKPKLVGVASTSPREVLSDGEQTAAGLAGLFTEVAFDATKSAVVVDDPVTSLDHQRRDRVARRLVEVAVERQVVVFTHDLMFLGGIVRATQDLDVPLTERSIERTGLGRPGLVVDGYPWKAKDATARMHVLRTELDALKKKQATMTADDWEGATADWAGRLSETWERIVRTEVANRVVDRGTSEVRPKMFRLLARISEDDNTDFQAGYTAVSTWTRRHDKSEEFNYTAPTSADMDAELTRITNWFKRIRSYAN